MLPRTERLDRLRLIRTDKVGPVTYRHLLDLYGTAGAALAALPDLAKRGGGKAPRIPAKAEAERELAALSAADCTLSLLGEASYPPLLAEIEGAPPALILKGHEGLAARPVVAIVGARNASAAGLRLARDIASGLGRAGISVVSGLARGIDAAAHQACLDSGTVAVVAGGIDVVYPPEHADLQDRIGTAGLIVSEMPLGTVPQARHFPRRNRLISGLSTGIVVIEAALKSGSLITARFALEQNREVMAVPGSPLDPRARGTNDLIRQGARLVESAEDVIAAIGSQFGGGAEAPPTPPYRPSATRIPDDKNLASARAVISSLLSPVPVAVDELIRMSDLTPPIIFTILLELELADRLIRHAGGRVSLA